MVLLIHADREDPSWVTLLRDHLRPFEAQNELRTWSRSDVAVGECAGARTAEMLDAAVVGILLVSPLSLADGEARDHMLPRLRERGVPLLPVPVRSAPSSALSAAGLGTNGPTPATPWDRPLQALTGHERDVVLVRVVERVLELMRPARDDSERARVGRLVIDYSRRGYSVRHLSDGVWLADDGAENLKRLE